MTTLSITVQGFQFAVTATLDAAPGGVWTVTSGPTTATGPTLETAVNALGAILRGRVTGYAGSRHAPPGKTGT